jgi:zinc-ribbon domain
VSAEATCANCGSALPAESRFCPECGARVGAAPGETAIQEVPPHEERPAPVDVMWAERRFFGVPPSTALFGIGIGALVLAVVLLATGHPLWALLLGAVAVLSLVGFVSQTRRLPAEASGVARASVQALETVKARAEATIDTVAAHGNARIELLRLRREAGRLGEEREVRLRDLGVAVYEGDRKATKELKEALRELDARIESAQEAMQQVTDDTRERVREAQLPVQATRIVAPDSAEDDAESHALFPPRAEPFPPEDEADRRS